MNSAEPAFPNQSSLLMAYHQQGLLFNPQKQVDFLSLSQNNLNNHINPYALAQNPQALLNMGLTPQVESPEKAIISQNVRKIPNEQIAGLLALGHPSTNDLFATRPQNSPMASSLHKRVETSVSQPSRQSLERTLPPHANSQINSIAQLLEANDLKAQAQKNLNELLLFQLSGNKNFHNTSNTAGYPFYLNYQNSPINYGGLVSNQNFFYGQSQPEKVIQPVYTPHSEDIIVLDNPVKKSAEVQQILHKKAPTSSAQDIIIVHDNEIMPKTPKSTVKVMDEVKLINLEQSPPQILNQLQTSLPKQNESLNLSIPQNKPIQSPIPIQATKKAVVIEPIEQEQEKSPSKTTKEIQQNTMISEPKSVVETPNINLTMESQSIYLNNNFIEVPSDQANSSLWSNHKVKNNTICKVCYDAFTKGQCCFFCHQIYLDDETSASSDDKDWIECEACQTWNHIDCEVQHGIKNLRNLIEKNTDFKYFCPNCKVDKSFRSPVRNNKNTPKLDSQSRPSSPSSVSIEPEPQKTTTQHSKPDLNDEIAIEEGVKEPNLRKVRLNDNYKVQIAEPSRQTNDSTDPARDDFVKKKLDSMLNKYQINKKKYKTKVIINPAAENFAFIEKLLGQYGGKRLQLSEFEVRNDIELCKEMTSCSDSSKNGRVFRFEDNLYNQTGNGDLTDKEANDSSLAQTPVISRNSRPKNKGQRPANKKAQVEIDFNDDGDMNDIIEHTKKNGKNRGEPGRTLRNKKKVE